jgi:predicted TIM-barrel enzyme
MDNEIFQAIAGVIKANCDRTLTRDLINEIFSQFRQIGENIICDRSGGPKISPRPGRAFQSGNACKQDEVGVLPSLRSLRTEGIP